MSSLSTADMTEKLLDQMAKSKNNKEFLQIMRDNSSILIGAVLPIILILLIGYGISLDVKKSNNRSSF